MSPRSFAIAAALVAALLATFAAGVVQAAPIELHANLNARAEVPRTDSDATGAAEFRVAANRRSIRYELDASGLSGPPMAAHIHVGRPGQAGGIVLSIALQQFTLPREGRLTAKDFTPVGNVKTFRQAIRAMRAGRTYVNIHTERFPAGEIRGQVRVDR